MSGRHIMNYIARQRRQRKIDTEEILRLWRDYLSMASRIKMDVQKEIVYRPADIKQAHDDLVKLCDNRNVMKRAGEIVQKYPDVDDILQSIKPNLPKLLYIGSKPIPQTAYKINDCGSFFFTNICINDII